MSQSRPLADKSINSGFGPYELVAPDEPCLRHGLVPISEPHRCDACVREVTLGVFDVDRGTVAEVDRMLGLLEKGGVSYIIYSTWSYRPEAEVPALRLVVPFDKPVPAESWRGWRRAFIHRYSVPADVDKCQAPSHFYYAPAHRPGVEPLFLSHDAGPVRTESLPMPVKAYLAPNPTPEADCDWGEMAPEALEEWRRLLEKKARRLSKRTLEDRQKAEVIERMLAGQVLAEHGSRNQTSTWLAALVLAAWHGGTPGGAYQLMAPSLEAMRAAGSKLDERTLKRQIASAFTKVTASRAQRARFEEELAALLLSSVPQ